MKIYLIEDDIVLRREIADLLSSHEYECRFDDDYENIVELALSYSPDIVLLDLGLPNIDGNYVCKKIREESNVPIIVITSRNNDIDEIMSINLGANDYITKPFNKYVLLARIESLVRTFNSISAKKDSILRHKELELSLDKYQIKYKNKHEDITKNEMKILTVLMTNAGSYVERNIFLEELWQSGDFIDDNTLTVNINRIRKKLETLGLSDFIETKRGFGYRI